MKMSAAVSPVVDLLWTPGMMKHGWNARRVHLGFMHSAHRKKDTYF